MTQVVVAAAGVVVRARAGDEADLHGPLAGIRRVLRRAADGDFFHRVQTRADTREEAVGRLQLVVLRRDPVDRDVDGALRQAVDRGIAAAARRVHARQHRDEVERAAAARRQLEDLVGVERRRHRRRLRLDDFRGAVDGDGLLEPTDFQLHANRCRGCRVDHDVIGDGGLEPGEGHGDAVGTGIDRRNGKPALFVRRRGELDAGGGALHDHAGARYHGARRVRDCSDD